MIPTLAFVYRTAVALLFGAQVFFAAIAAPAAFPSGAASLPPEDPRRTAAADLVGRQLLQLDRLTLALTGLAALSAITLARLGRTRALLAALPPVLAGLCALLSSAWVTPQIRGLRAAGQTLLPRFAALHRLSTALLGAEILLLLGALWLAPDR